MAKPHVVSIIDFVPKVMLPLFLQGVTNKIDLKIVVLIVVSILLLFAF